MKPKFVRFHLADAEDRIVDVGVVKLIPDGLEKLRGRRIRVFPYVDAAGHNAARRIGQSIAAVATETQIFDLRGLYRDDDAPVRDLFDVTRIGYESFEANRDLWSVTNLDSKGERVKIVTHKHESFLHLPFPLMGLLSLTGFLCILCLTLRNWKVSLRNWRKLSLSSAVKLGPSDQ